jgi:pimeloyl-ACP methyl ester carboxylesterase
MDGTAMKCMGENGKPVLLLHGIGGAGASFATQLPALAARHRVFAWDAPGYGASADPAQPPNMSGYADIVAGLLDGLGAGSAHVVGVSWGGVIATRLALEHPELMRSLVLVDSTRGAGTSSESAARMRCRTTELSEVGPCEFARRRARRLVAPGTGAALIDRIEATMSQVRAAGYGAAAESMASTDHGPALASIALPTLVLVGEHDEITGVPESRLLAGEVPGARLRIIGGGHAAHQESAAEFTDALLDFFAEVDAVVTTGGS